MTNAMQIAIMVVLVATELMVCKIVWQLARIIELLEAT